MTEEESRRRIAYMLRLRKMEDEDREREEILAAVRAQRDNQFLADCGITPVVFERGQIVPWKGLLCQKT